VRGAYRRAHGSGWRASRSRARGGPAWTSNLAVAEVLALRTLRVEPVAHVVGASVYRMPARAFKGKGNVASRELPAVSRALADVHARALRRLCAEASLVGAHGVVDVRIAYHEDEWGRSLIEAVARGTAVRVPGCPPLDPPFLGAMPAQDIGCLWRGGYTPVTIVTGCVAFYVSSTLTAAQQTIGADFRPRNIEINDRTVDLSEAWRRARRRLADAAESLGAEGVVGVETRRRVHAVRAGSVVDHVVEISTTETALVGMPGARSLPAPSLTIDLA